MSGAFKIERVQPDAERDKRNTSKHWKRRCRV